MAEYDLVIGKRVLREDHLHERLQLTVGDVGNRNVGDMRFLLAIHHRDAPEPFRLAAAIGSGEYEKVPGTVSIDERRQTSTSHKMEPETCQTPFPIPLGLQSGSR